MYKQPDMFKTVSTYEGWGFSFDLDTQRPRFDLKHAPTLGRHPNVNEVIELIAGCVAAGSYVHREALMYMRRHDMGIYEFIINKLYLIYRENNVPHSKIGVTMLKDLGWSEERIAEVIDQEDNPDYQKRRVILD